ncbi:hypothetical protein [Marinobacter salicampi]|uniref:hypothetical protein n=1 Tax=Marinobacter salicampi TaxID=435907 RepID=UPI0014075950|nr:hypothetical protein [Marinobacter salicampi]
MSKRLASLPPNIAELDYQSQLGYVALRAFFQICEDWNTTVAEQCKLMRVGLLELEQLRKLPARPLERETLIRIRCYVLIYKKTARRAGTVDKAQRELRLARTGHPFFGKSPIHLMMHGGKDGVADACMALTGRVPEMREYARKAS